MSQHGDASGQMILITSIYPIGGHLAGWRHPDAYDEFLMNFDAVKNLTQLAEQGKFQATFLADGNAVRQMEKPSLFESPGGSDRPVSFEPLTLMAALAQYTEHIGLFVTATTTYEEPYLLARRLSSLDHLTGGRAIWNVVTGSYAGDSRNFGTEDLPDRYTRYARSEEFVEVCKKLWDSWTEDALIHDKESGRALDASRVRTVDHHGEYFNVQGPLNLSRSPQGYPVLFLAGQSEPGRELAAKHADCLFSVSRTKEEGVELYNDVKSRMAKYGRNPDDLKIIPAIRANVASTRQEAIDLYRELNAMVGPELGVEFLSSHLHFDLSGYDIDGPVPELPEEVLGVTSIRDALMKHVRAENMTIRQAYQYELAHSDVPPFTGTASEVADEMQEWFEAGACDGFNINPNIVPAGLKSIVDQLVPELQRRNLFHMDYRGGTLREELGLSTPVNQFFTPEHA
jgi:FMN-dependent oxidoreductase (nitrilotriacetate monooxygenase family)